MVDVAVGVETGAGANTNNEKDATAVTTPTIASPATSNISNATKSSNHTKTFTATSTANTKSSSPELLEKEQTTELAICQPCHPSSSNQPPPQRTLEKRLFHALHEHNINNPSIKEFKECWAFANAVKKYYYTHPRSNKNNHKTNSKSKEEQTSSTAPIQLILDVAGGHGALGALLLTLLPTTKKCVVIDPADVKGGVELAWNQFYNRGVEDNDEGGEGGGTDPSKKNIDSKNVSPSSSSSPSKKELVYRHECLRSGLKAEIENALGRTHSSSSSDSSSTSTLTPQQILVVACHACQHLSDETLEIACSYGVHVTVMPCCQKDLTTGGSIKAFAKQAQMNFGLVMDILMAGKVMSWKNTTAGVGAMMGDDDENNARYTYQVKMKMIDERITPQNRMIMCKSKKIVVLDDSGNGEDLHLKKMKDVAHDRLTKAYHAAHRTAKKKMTIMQTKVKDSICFKSLGLGVVAGVVVTISITLQRRK